MVLAGGAAVLAAAGGFFLFRELAQAVGLAAGPGLATEMLYYFLLFAAGAVLAVGFGSSLLAAQPVSAAVETGALVAFFSYGGYLHSRISHGWAGRRSVYFALVGFLLVIFTYLGVSYILPGLHTYAG